MDDLMYTRTRLAALHEERRVLDHEIAKLELWLAQLEEQERRVGTCYDVRAEAPAFDAWLKGRGK